MLWRCTPCAAAKGVFGDMLEDIIGILQGSAKGNFISAGFIPFDRLKYLFRLEIIKETFTIIWVQIGSYKLSPSPLFKTDFSVSLSNGNISSEHWLPKTGFQGCLPMFFFFFSQLDDRKCQTNFLNGLFLHH